MGPSSTASVAAATLVAWAALAVLVLLSYASASAWPPPGRFFSGAFAFQDDFWRVLGIGLLLRGATLMLEGAGLTGRRLAWSVALVATGGGMGWRRLWQGVPPMGVADVGTCLYTWWEALVSGHALVGTALLLLALAGHVRWREGRAPRWRWLVAATVLGLCRPFDFGLFLLVVAAAAGHRLVRGPSRREPLDQLAQLLWLGPVLVYDLLIFGFHLKQECRPGDVLLAPMDPGLIVAGLAPCLVVLGHRVLTPGFASRVEEVRRFYTRETSPLWRRGYLELWDRMEPVPSDGP